MPSSARWHAVVRLGLAYVALVFAVGFALGVVRVLALEPALGRLGAVAVELPMILAAAWAICGWLLRRLPLLRAVDRAAAGVLALLVLLALDAGVALALPGRALADHVAAYATPSGALGLLGQLLFAVFPVLHPAGRR